MQEMQVRYLGREDPLEKEMATHSSSLAWEIPWAEEPDRLQSMRSQRETQLSDYRQQQRDCGLGLGLGLDGLGLCKN